MCRNDIDAQTDVDLIHVNVRKGGKVKLRRTRNKINESQVLLIILWGVYYRYPTKVTLYPSVHVDNGPRQIIMNFSFYPFRSHEKEIRKDG